jgi:DNA polymerase III subunit gamma/tau
MEYRVLARKYRPATFADLIGQETLVRTLSNAIASGRIAHAFLLTGIRGVGKTTTARIIARALNCLGEDGNGGPTISPCGTCANCRMIAEDRHVDVLEMDAASHTGVDDIRQLIDTVRYLPSSARYKIYIIDEVHMLSGNAFNALLKTLEEPPPHVKFVFATTESRKIPVTILSRCQRFDLKRVERDTLARHLGAVAAKENIAIEGEALALIAQAAEGSVRDALSLLDQAIANAGTEMIAAAGIRRMIGGADNAASFELLKTVLSGDVAGALSKVQAQYAAGVDPLLMVQDALETAHLVTRVKVAPAALDDVTLSQQDREAAKSLADTVTMPVLTRLWQMLLKGISEVRLAPQPVAALEMLLVRIAYAAQLPTPAEILKSDGTPAAAKTETPKPKLELVNAAPAPKAHVADFAEAVAMFDRHREPLLYMHLKRDVRLVAFEQGRITVKPTMTLPRDFTARVGNALSEWMGTPWKILLSDAEGAPSLHEQETANKQQKIDEAAAHPLVSSALEQFPGAKVVGVKTNA